MRPLLSEMMVTAGGCCVRAWAEPGSADVPMQDVLHWSVTSGRLRVAAIDGCTPMTQSPRPAGVNAATYAATVIGAALGEPGDVTDILAVVNAHLVALGEDLIAAARPSATVAVVEVTPVAGRLGGRLAVQAWAAGDAEVWALRARRWHQVAGGPCTTDDTRQQWRPQREALQAAGVPFATIQQREAEYFADPTLFVHHTPVGRFPQLVVQQKQLLCDAVAVATDGALLHSNAVASVPGWLAQVRAAEASLSRLKATDDLAVALITPTLSGDDADHHDNPGHPGTAS